MFLIVDMYWMQVFIGCTYVLDVGTCWMQVCMQGCIGCTCVFDVGMHVLCYYWMYVYMQYGIALDVGMYVVCTECRYVCMQYVLDVGM